METKWTKGANELWTCLVGPFALKVQPKGDGRWSWQVFNEGAVNPMGTGVATSLGAAKRVTEELVKRSGRV